MNGTNIIQTKVTVPKMKWHRRHKKIFFVLATGTYTLIGGFAGMLIVLGLKTNHCAAFGVIISGLLFGQLTGCACFLVDRICFPEETGANGSTSL